jgi:hypothetical protein
VSDIEDLKRHDIVQAGRELDAAMAGDGTFIQRTEMRRLTLRLTAVDKKIEEAAMADGHMRASIYGGEGVARPDDSLTPGEAFVRSEAYELGRAVPERCSLVRRLEVGNGLGRPDGQTSSAWSIRP